MALVKGNQTSGVVTTSAPSWNQGTISHTHNSGVDGFLMVAITMTNTTIVSSVNYGSQSMNLLTIRNFGGQSQNFSIFGLLNPPTGNNVVQINTISQQFNGISVLAQSFLGSAGFGNFGINGATTTPNSRTLTVSAGSAIYATGISSNAFTDIEIDGSSRGMEFQHNVNKQVAGSFSLIPLTAGSKNVATKVTFNVVTNQRFEIKASGGTPPVSENNFLIMF